MSYIGSASFYPYLRANASIILNAETGNIYCSNNIQSKSISMPNMKFIYNLNDLPTPVSSIITLEDDTSYYFTTTVDLSGNRLICGENTTIIGTSSETAYIQSTGLIGTALITSNYSLPMRNISIIADIAVNLNGNSFPNTLALDWNAVNFVNCNTIGTIQNYNNFVMTSSAFLNSSNLTFDGQINTIAFDTCLWSGGTGTYITLPSTLTINRRFRIIYSSLVVSGINIGIDADNSLLVPTENYILDTVNFTGGGTYLSGISPDDNRCLFTNSIGIENTAVNGIITMTNNSTATTVSATNTFYKIAGTTTEGIYNQKISMPSNNRLECNAIIRRRYFISAVLSFTSGNNNVCQFGIYLSSLGTVITNSIAPTTANTAGRAENVGIQCIVEMQNGDYIELWGANTSATSNITVSNLNLAIFQI